MILLIEIYSKSKDINNHKFIHKSLSNISKIYIKNQQINSKK